ncbi:MAG: hypothetical protein HLUCCO18_13315 [Rhodobacteraceae bacterium HLUCCO18]|nr:MAG: hypothetical protein HLUCCO18_13315 [Rhodobacteraceae bacterium HLUCCO18]
MSRTVTDRDRTVVITGACSGFGEMLSSDEAPDPQLVVDTCLGLADA